MAWKALNDKVLLVILCEMLPMESFMLNLYLIELDVTGGIVLRALPQKILEELMERGYMT